LMESFDTLTLYKWDYYYYY